MMIKHVFLDIGDTLITFKPGTCPAQHIAQLLQSSSLEHIVRIVFCENHRTVTSLIASLESHLERTLSSAVRHHIRDVWTREYSNWTLAQNVQEFLTSLAQLGLTLHLASNTWYPLIESLRAQIGDEQMATKTLSFQIGMMKSRKFYELALEHAHAHASESVMVGDSISDDILPSRELGLIPILILRHSVNTTMLPDETYIVRDFDDVLHVIKELNSKTPDDIEERGKRKPPIQ